MKYQPDRHPKLWGYEDWIANNPVYGYCGKILFVEQGKHCSMHFHIKKHETFHILEGSVMMHLIEADGTRTDIIMVQNDSLVVPQGLMHQFEAIVDTKILEVSSLHDEADSYRVHR